MYNQLKSEFLKLKYSRLFVAVPILFVAGLLLYGSFSLSAGEHRYWFRRVMRRQMQPYRARLAFLHLHLKIVTCPNSAKSCSPVYPAMCFCGLLPSF